MIQIFRWEIIARILLPTLDPNRLLSQSKQSAINQQKKQNKTKNYSIIYSIYSIIILHLPFRFLPILHYLSPIGYYSDLIIFRVFFLLVTHFL
jgi:hypothetical protein